MPKGGGFHKRGFTGAQMSIMLKAYREQIGAVGDEYAQAFGEDAMFEELLEAVPTEPEWVFHGTTAAWDTIYAAGGIKRVGDNVSVSEHVHSSMSNASGYIATSRALSVAVSFAKGKWIYLIYSTAGMMAITSLHNQDEVIIPGDVPIRDIYMMRNLEDANKVHINLEFKGPKIINALEAHCLRLISGG